MRDFSKVKRIIIKIGSSSLVHEDFSMNVKQIQLIMRSFFHLRERNIQVALVTSGAIAVGMSQIGLSARPKEMALKQACAAVGQAKLMEAYNYAANALGLVCGQILINHDDFQIRKRMLYLSDTLDAMFKNNIIPIINENDALAVEEIKVGDNDTLAALIAPMIHADLLVLFSDIDGLYTKNPKEFTDAKLVSTVEELTSNIYQMAGVSKSLVGTGGMITKLKAALISTTANCHMIICNSNRISDLENIVNGEEIGTLFKVVKKSVTNREHWMIFNANALGSVTIDDGCLSALLQKKISILPIGVINVESTFLADSVINVKDLTGRIIAKGITNYSSDEIKLIMGKNSLESNRNIIIKKKEIIHANNLVMITKENR